MANEVKPIIKAKWKEGSKETGLVDMHGEPLLFGDRIRYHHRPVRQLYSNEKLDDFSPDEIVGQGFMGFVYTGRVIRYNGVADYDESYGLDFGLPGRFHWWKFHDGNKLLRVEKVMDQLQIQTGAPLETVDN